MSTKSNALLTLEDYLAREEFRARFDAEKARVERHYCTLFGFWRRCEFKPCRRERACRGDQHECLTLSINRISRRNQFDARQQLLQATPRNLAAPERAARDIMPGEFSEASASFRPRDIPPGWMRAGARPPRRRKRRTGRSATLTPHTPSAQNDSR